MPETIRLSKDPLADAIRYVTGTDPKSEKVNSNWTFVE